MPPKRDVSKTPPKKRKRGGGNSPTSPTPPNPPEVIEDHEEDTKGKKKKKKKKSGGSLICRKNKKGEEDEEEKDNASQDDKSEDSSGESKMSRGSKGKGGGKKRGGKDEKKADKKGTKKETPKGKDKDDKKEEEDKAKGREGWSKEPKPTPIKPEIANPLMPDDKTGIQRILQLVTVYDDPDYGGCVISGLLSGDILLFAIKKTHLLPSVVEHPCTVVAKHQGRIIGICLCTDKEDEEWESAWAHLKANFPQVADRDEILKQAYRGEATQAGRTLAVHQLAVETRFRRMTVGYQMLKKCVEIADDEQYHRVSILCTDAFSALICKKLKFQKVGEPLHYKRFNHPTTGRLIYKCIYKKPHKRMQHYAIRL